MTKNLGAYDLPNLGLKDRKNFILQDDISLFQGQKSQAKLETDLLARFTIESIVKRNTSMRP